MTLLFDMNQKELRTHSALTSHLVLLPGSCKHQDEDRFPSELNPLTQEGAGMRSLSLTRLLLSTAADLLVLLHWIEMR